MHSKPQVARAIFVGWESIDTRAVRIKLYNDCVDNNGAAIESHIVTSIAQLKTLFGRLQNSSHAATSLWIPITAYSNTLSIQQLIEPMVHRITRIK